MAPKYHPKGCWLLSITTVCYVGCLTCMSIAVSTPSWSTARQVGAPPEGDRISKVGLVRFSATGECATDECRAAWEADESIATDTCEDFLSDFKGGFWSSCSYKRRGYCVCSYLESYILHITPKPSCKTKEFGDTEAEDALFYADKVDYHRGAAYGCLIAAMCLVSLALLVQFGICCTNCAGDDPPLGEWERAPDCTMCFSVPALPLLMASLIEGVRYAKLFYLAPYCGSQAAFDLANEQKEQAGGLQTEVDGFGLGPWMCLAGCALLLLPWVVYALLLCATCLSCPSKAPQPVEPEALGSAPVEPNPPLTSVVGEVAFYQGMEAPPPWLPSQAPPPSQPPACQSRNPISNPLRPGRTPRGGAQWHPTLRSAPRLPAPPSLRLRPTISGGDSDNLNNQGPSGCTEGTELTEFRVFFASQTPPLDAKNTGTHLTGPRASLHPGPVGRARYSGERGGV